MMTEIYKDSLYRIELTDNSVNSTLFNSERFIAHQRRTFNNAVKIFNLYANENNKLLASLDFAKKEQVWITPITGAFGHCLTESKTPSSLLELFINQIAEHLINHENASAIIWKTPPLYFDSLTNHKIHNILFRSNWKTITSDLNFHLMVTDLDDFRSRMNSTKRKELNKWNRCVSNFSQAETLIERNACYEIIRANRAAQGYPMTMSYEAVSALGREIPEDIFFFSLSEEDIIVASAIVLRLNETTLYVFYWGENPAFRSRSPVVKLCEHLYRFALENNYKTLDIGTSTADSIPNEGLVNFKVDIGCQVSQKNIFRTQPKRS